MNRLLDRFPARVVALVAAVVLALVAVVAVNDWLRTREAELVEAFQPVAAWQFAADLPAGTPAGSLFLDAGGPNPARLRETLTTPESLPAGALRGDLTGLGKRFLAEDVRAGEFLVASMFVETAPEDVEAFVVPGGQVAIAFDVDATQGVANFLDPGDRISILATVEGSTGADPAAGGGALTRFVLQDVEVLAIGRRSTAEQGDDDGEVVVRDDALVTLTVALDPFDAERLVFAVTNGTLHIALLPDDVDGFTPATTPGRSAGNLFER